MTDGYLHQLVNIAELKLTTRGSSDPNGYYLIELPDFDFLNMSIVPISVVKTNITSSLYVPLLLKISASHISRQGKRSNQMQILNT